MMVLTWPFLPSGERVEEREDVLVLAVHPGLTALFSPPAGPLDEFLLVLSCSV